MRQAFVVVAALAIAVAIAVGGNTVGKHWPQSSAASTASNSISVMQLMKDAKNLPEEGFDAH
ncbi:MAG: hypothetical protein AB7O44_13475 [Hyphomicrobiaceae bacterium]